MEFEDEAIIYSSEIVWNRRYEQERVANSTLRQPKDKTQGKHGVLNLDYLAPESEIITRRTVVLKYLPYLNLVSGKSN